MPQTMVPISGRIEDDLYEWFVSLQYPGARTNSDKLREALKELRQQRDASANFLKAQKWLHSLTDPMRSALAVFEQDQASHSEVLASLSEHVTAMAAVVLSARIDSVDHARKVEEQLVRRAIDMTEILFRQALTPSAAAFDADVVQRHLTRLSELATLINRTKQGERNG